MVGSNGARIILLKKFRRKIPARRKMGPIVDLKVPSLNWLFAPESKGPST
jgi:hypothetical protein